MSATGFQRTRREKAEKERELLENKENAKIEQRKNSQKKDTKTVKVEKAGDKP